MAKFNKQSLCQKYFSAIKLCAKYQKASVKALVQVDFPVYTLSKHKQNPYLKANRKKLAKFTKLSFCQ